MKDRLDPLIAERAPWVFRDGPGATVARHGLTRLLGYPGTVALAEALEPLRADEIMARMGARLARDVAVTGLSHLPQRGPALVVATHPTGIADGIILHHVLSQVRPDLFFYANADILRVLPQLRRVIVPVEWRADKRSHAKTRATLADTGAAVAAGRMGVIFPSGRLAKRRGLRLHERPWMASAAMIARKFDLPVVPIHIGARNSALFYLFDAIHPTLRDITLFHETLNKHRQPFRISVGEPISAAALPARSETGIAMLRAACLALGEPDRPGVSLIRATRRPSWV